MIQSVQQGLQAEGLFVPITKLCTWFGVARRTVYYKPVKSPPKIDSTFEAPIKAMIEGKEGKKSIRWIDFPTNAGVRLSHCCLASWVQQ